MLKFFPNKKLILFLIILVGNPLSGNQSPLIGTIHLDPRSKTSHLRWTFFSRNLFLSRFPHSENLNENHSNHVDCSISVLENSGLQIFRYASDLSQCILVRRSCCLCLLSSQPKTETWLYSQIHSGPRIFAVIRLHGEFDA